MHQQTVGVEQRSGVARHIHGTYCPPFVTLGIDPTPIRSDANTP